MLRYVAEPALTAEEEAAIRAESREILGFAADVDCERMAEIQEHLAD